jgi:hypothetical protein
MGRRFALHPTFFLLSKRRQKLLGLITTVLVVVDQKDVLPNNSFRLLPVAVDSSQTSLEGQAHVFADNNQPGRPLTP